MSKKQIALLAAGIGCLVPIALIFMGLVWVGVTSPETYAYEGDEVPARFVRQVRDLGLLEEDDEILYLYSDALLDLEEGVYFLTHRNLVAYSEAWDEPRTVIPYEDITVLEVEYDDSFFVDTMLFLETDAMTLSIPVSSERGRDRDFVRVIEESVPIVAVER